MNSVRVAAMVLAVAGGMGLGAGLGGSGVAVGQGAAGPAAGAGAKTQVPAVKMPDNAAVVYFRYWSLVTREQWAKVADLATELTVPDAAGREALRQLIEELGSVPAGLARTTQIPRAEWNVEFDQGIGAIIPEMGVLRSTARLFVAQARLSLADGRADEAAQHVARIFPLARHTSDGSMLLISSLVSAAINSLGCASVEALLRDGRITEAGRAVLLEAMQSHMGGADPFKMAAAIQAERWLIAQW
ncbi:MAG: hypothetical protein ACK5ZV_05760, partial [bacterium]